MIILCHSTRHDRMQGIEAAHFTDAHFARRLSFISILCYRNLFAQFPRQPHHAAVEDAIALDYSFRPMRPTLRVCFELHILRPSFTAGDDGR